MDKGSPEACLRLSYCRLKAWPITNSSATAKPIKLKPMKLKDLFH